MTQQKRMGRPVRPSAAGNKVARARAALELSQLQLAQRWGVSRASVAHWEAERYPIPGPILVLCNQILDEEN